MFPVYTNARCRPGATPNLTEQAYCSIKQLICTNTFGRGLVLEQDLAARLNMSRTPVREASIRLAAQGLLEVLPRRGVRQVSLPQSTIRELYELVHHVSMPAVSKIARLGPRIATAELLPSTFLWDEAARDNDAKAFAKHEAQFYGQLFKIGGTELVSRVLQPAIVHLSRVWHALDAIPNRPRLVAPGATAIVEALLASDDSRALDALAQANGECAEYISNTLKVISLEAV